MQATKLSLHPHDNRMPATYRWFYRAKSRFMAPLLVWALIVFEVDE